MQLKKEMLGHLKKMRPMLKSNRRRIKGNFFYIGRAPNDFDTKTLKEYTKSGSTDDPRRRRPQYDTNQHEPFQYHYLYKVLNMAASLVEKLFHDKVTKHLKGEVVTGVKSAGIEIRFSTPNELNKMFLEMCGKYKIKIEKINIDDVLRTRKKYDVRKVKHKQYLLNDIRETRKLVLRDYQRETIRLIKSNKTYEDKSIKDRGQVILPTGTGKTEIMIRLTEDLMPGAKIAYFVPNLNLIQQFYKVIRGKLDTEITLIVIASDLNSAIDDKKLIVNPSVKSLRAAFELNEDVIILSTYSSESIQKLLSSDIYIDIGFFDESHRTVGSLDTNKAKLLFNKNLQIRYRYFFTATRRFFKGTSDNVSMNNEKQYGPIINFLSYRTAISYDYLTDYTIINTYSNVYSDNVNHVVSSIRHGFSEYPIKKMLVYCNKCSEAKSLRDSLEENFADTSIGVDLSSVKIFYISGSTRSADREEIFKYFRDSNYDDQPAIICSVNTINEGIDLVKADAICFAESRKSELNIVQILGRILRKDSDKHMAYVLIPSTDGDFNQIKAVYQALAKCDEIPFKSTNNKSGSSLTVDEIIGKICENLITQKIDSIGRVIGSDTRYAHDEVIRIMRNISSEIQSSGMLSKWEYIFEKMKEIADENNIFTRSQINNYINDFNTKYGGYNGKTPKNTMSRDLQKVFRDRFEVLQFTPRGKKGEYKIIKNTLY